MINEIYCGNNLKIMRDIPNESINLIYLDPPFFTGRNWEIIWNDEKFGAEMRKFEDTSAYFKEQNKIEENNYNEIHNGGLQHYIAWMVRRLREMHRILKSNGTICLHVDWRAVHYLKIEMDKIFGYNNFINEVIWSYKNMTSKSKNYQRKHQTLLFYSKNKEYTFNTEYEMTEINIKNYKKGYFTTYQFNKKINKKIKTLIVYDSNNEKVKKIINNGKFDKIDYKENKNGTPIRDVWEISAVNGNSKENIGYKTQKPEKLLERIIKVNSNPGDIILDPFMGGGTTLTSAQKLNRQFIGIDVSLTACRTAANRINFDIFKIYGSPKTLNDFKNMSPHEYQNWCCEKMQAINTNPHPERPSGRDGGIDGRVKDIAHTFGYENALLDIKRMENIGEGPILNLFDKMEKENQTKGFVIALSFTKGAKEKVAIYELEKNINIKLVTAEELGKVQKYDYIALE